MIKNPFSESLKISLDCFLFGEVLPHGLLMLFNISDFAGLDQSLAIGRSSHRKQPT